MHTSYIERHSSRRFHSEGETGCGVRWTGRWLEDAFPISMVVVVNPQTLNPEKSLQSKHKDNFTAGQRPVSENSFTATSDCVNPEVFHSRKLVVKCC